MRRLGVVAVTCFALVGCTSNNPSSSQDLAMGDLASGDGGRDLAPAGSDAGDLLSPGGSDGSDGMLDFCANLSDGTACPNGGLCKGGVCSSCVDGPAASGGDDAICATAYSGAYLCIGGACTPGNCRPNGGTPACSPGDVCGVVTPYFCAPGCNTNADCPTGQICGANNQCAKCSNDSQCQSSYGSNYVCNTTNTASNGQCVVNSGLCTGTTCNVNASDICCGGLCVGGNCCTGDATTGTSVWCTANGGSACASNACTCVADACTKCSVPGDGIFHVDPTITETTGPTGNTTGGCEFKSITHAVRFLKSYTPGSYTIEVDNEDPAANETYPITLPANTKLTANARATTVHLGGGTAGFILSQPGTSVVGITLDGGGPGSASPSPSPSPGAAAFGIVVGAFPSPSPTPSPVPLIEDVTVENMAKDGILVYGWPARVGQGVQSLRNGGNGIHVNGTSAALGELDLENSNVAAGEQVQLKTNSGHGIDIDRFGYGTVSGVISSGTGTIEASGNGGAGLYCSQDTATAQPTSVTALVADNNLRGLHVFAGSKLKVRGANLLHNGTHGVLVSQQTVGTTSTDLTTIDLGKSGSAGDNDLQSSTNGNPSGGICVNFTPVSTTLSAEGNSFTGVDCSTTAGTLSHKNGGCSGQVDVATAFTLTPTQFNSVFDVAMCTY